MELILSAAWLGLVTWFVWRAFCQRDALRALPTRAVDVAEGEDVAAIVPARDEAHNIAPCLASLLAQTYPADKLRIVVVDDESTDDTAAIAASFAPRVRVLRAGALPPGWKGKVHACVAGATAVPPGIKWLCFMDADMRAAPALISSALAETQARGLDLLSLAPRHELQSFAERLMIPCGLYLLAFTQDLARIQAPDSKQVVAMGQFMLVRRAAYASAGGHAAVRDAISEDVALAKLMKWHGCRVELQDGSQLLSGRMYTGWTTLWPGIAKNLSEMLGGTFPTVLTALAAVVLSWAAVLLPLADALSCAGGSRTGCYALGPALAASAAAFGLHIAGAIHFGIPFLYGLLFPLGYSIGAAMGFDSLRRRLTRRVSWKGRVYP